MNKRKTIHISNMAGMIITTLVTLAAVTTVVLATYTGPDRTYTYYTTTYERKQCHYTGIKDYPGVGYCACSYNKYVTTSSSCPAIDTGLFTNSACSWTGICATYSLTDTSSSSSTQSCSASDTGATAVQVKHTTAHPEATVFGNLDCSTTGANGWCIAPEAITITGAEPLLGYSITDIEGTLNGNGFNCSGSSCQVNLVEGPNAFSYWAVSSYGDTSLLSNFSANQDTQKPQVSISMGGTTGLNGWYTSGIVSGSAIDPTPGSGIDTFTYSLDGAANVNYTTPLTLAAGEHTVSMTVTDKAGLTGTESQLVSVDLDDPKITSSVTGTVGNNSWYTTDVMLTGFATDPAPGSGLDTFTVADNSSPSVNFLGSTVLSDGQHSVTLRAEDFAGRVATEEETINVDTQKPEIATNIAGTSGTNGWYNNVNLYAITSDQTPGSGVDTFEYSLDGSGWLPFPGLLVLTDGMHTIDFRATDLAGWTKDVLQAVNVDSEKPTLTVNVTGSTSDHYTYSTDVVISISGMDTLSGLARIEYSDNGGSWISDADPITFTSGKHTVVLRSVDIAGNVSNETTVSMQIIKSGPYIEMPSQWTIYESPDALIKAAYAPLAGVRITFSDPQNRWAAYTKTISISGSSYDASLAWNRVYANGIYAPIGTVNVSVEAWDTMGNHSAATGTIKIELDPTATPTITPEPTMTSTPTQAPKAAAVIRATDKPVPSPTAEVVSVAEGVSVKTKAKTRENVQQGLKYGTLLAFLGMITLSVAADRRPLEINKLNEQIEIYIKNKEDLRRKK